MEATIQMLNHRFECSICREDNRGHPALECCGQKYCALCLLKTQGQCMVCAKDFLNSENTCHLCDKVQNYFSITQCMQPTCTAQVCGECNNTAENGPMVFCSRRCNFQAYMLMRPFDEFINKIQKK